MSACGLPDSLRLPPLHGSCHHSIPLRNNEAHREEIEDLAQRAHSRIRFFRWGSYMNNSHVRTHVSKCQRVHLRCSLQARHPTKHCTRRCGLAGVRHPRSRNASATERFYAFQAGGIRGRTARTRFEATPPTRHPHPRAFQTSTRGRRMGAVVCLRAWHYFPPQGDTAAAHGWQGRRCLNPSMDSRNHFGEGEDQDDQENGVQPREADASDCGERSLALSKLTS